MLVIQSKKLTTEQKLVNLKTITTDHHYNKYITTPEFNKLTSENFIATLAKASLASKNDIANLLKKTDFDIKLKNLNRNVISNKNQLNELPQKFKAISRKELTKKLINKFSIANGAKYFLLNVRRKH